eukprot:11359459-Alexandrium_andersonii.AAC.1
MASDEVAVVVMRWVGGQVLGGQGQDRQQQLRCIPIPWSGHQRHPCLTEGSWKCPFRKATTGHPEAVASLPEPFKTDFVPRHLAWQLQ